MSIMTFFHSRFLRIRHERLLFQTQVLIYGLFTLEIAEKKLRKARKYQKDHRQESRWDKWSWLIRTHKMAQQQLSLLRACGRKIKQAGRLGLDAKQLEDFRACFQVLDAECTDPKELVETIESTWSQVQESVLRIRPPVFFTHAFLKFSHSSGIETASLIFGGLIALGIVHMTFFYQAGVGMPTNAYWTWDDLITSGILVIPQVLLLLLAVEAIFYFIRLFLGRRIGYRLHGVIIRRPASFLERRFGYRLHGMIVRHPVAVVLVFFGLAVFLVSFFGHSRGASAFENFMSMDTKDTQMATMMDRTVLNNVYLVGTTDRAAIFLRKKGGDDAASVTHKTRAQNERGNCKNNYGSTALAVLSTLGQGKANETRGKCSGTFDVLFMDRALMVCHAKKGQCEEALQDQYGQPSTVELKEIRKKMDYLENNLAVGLRTVSNQVKGIDAVIGNRFGELDDHMNRHLNQTLSAISDVGVRIDSRPPAEYDSE